MRHSRTWTTTFLLSSVLLILLVTFVFPQSVLRPFVMFAFLFFCPGMALLRTVPLSTRLSVTIALATALSLALDAVIATLVLYARLWSPSLILLLIVCFTLICTLVPLLRLSKKDLIPLYRGQSLASSNTDIQGNQMPVVKSSGETVATPTQELQKSPDDAIQTQKLVNQPLTMADDTTIKFAKPSKTQKLKAIKASASIEPDEVLSEEATVEGLEPTQKLKAIKVKVSVEPRQALQEETTVESPEPTQKLQPLKVSASIEPDEALRKEAAKEDFSPKMPQEALELTSNLTDVDVHAEEEQGDAENVAAPADKTQEPEIFDAQKEPKKVAEAGTLETEPLKGTAPEEVANSHNITKEEAEQIEI